MITVVVAILPFSTRFRWKHIGEITYIREIHVSYKYLLRPLSFPIESLDKLFIPIVHSSSSNMFLKIAKRLFEGRGETVNFSTALEYAWLVHRNLLEWSWGHFEIVWRVLNVILTKSLIIIISLICFLPNRMENGNKDSSSKAHLKSSKTIRGSYLGLEVSIFVKLFEF